MHSIVFSRSNLLLEATNSSSDESSDELLLFDELPADFCDELYHDEEPNDSSGTGTTL